jgi:hypothetical protein
VPELVALLFDDVAACAGRMGAAAPAESRDQP